MFSLRLLWAGLALGAAGLTVTGGLDAAVPLQSAPGSDEDARSAWDRAAPADVTRGGASHACMPCHENMIHSIGLAPHGLLTPDGDGCANCHGDVMTHARSEGEDFTGLIRFTPNSPTPVPDQNDKCLACHNQKSHAYWHGSTHEAEGMACAKCHRIMAPPQTRESLRVPPRPASARANLQQTAAAHAGRELCYSCHKMRGAEGKRTSHLAQGGLDCSDCHNPHGGPGGTHLKGATASDTCLTCHEDKRGPWLFEHAPVIDDCTTCHDPHASNNESLLVMKRPALCLECHSQTDYFHEFKGIASRYVVNRGCQNCHGLIHGSNHPAGGRLQR